MSIALGSTAAGLPLMSMDNPVSLDVTGPLERIVPPKDGNEKDKKMGIALVGLGKYSTDQLAPALKETKNCYLAGIVTGTPAKAKAWQKQYNIPETNCYTYENFDTIVNNKDIDIVYVVLPNSMHAEYVIRAAKAKKHVICEKPMATSVADAERMLAACKENNVMLSIGYRLHYEPFHKKIMELGQKEVFGKVKSITAHNGGDQTKGSLDIWRLNQKLSGGGPLMDMGVYCIQAACYTLGKNPIAVSAKFGENTKPGYFYDVEETITWKMEFEGGVTAECKSSYGVAEDKLEVTAEKGWFKLGPSFGYEGKKGETSTGKIDLPNVYEQAFQMDAQAESFRSKVKSITPGEMGLRDVKILMAVYESAQSGGKQISLKL